MIIDHYEQTASLLCCSPWIPCFFFLITNSSMKSYPHHYSRHAKSDDSLEANFRMMLNEMQHMEVRLGEKIKGRCSRLEQHVHDFDQRAKEKFIFLKMARTEANSESATMDKQFGDLKLEVGHINRFLERETMSHAIEKLGILNTNESAPRPPSSAPIDGPDGHRIEHHHRDRESGSVSTQTHIPVNGTIHPQVPFAWC
jgi:hypothetical protein